MFEDWQPTEELIRKYLVDLRAVYLTWHSWADRHLFWTLSEDVLGKSSTATPEQAGGRLTGLMLGEVQWLREMWVRHCDKKDSS